MSDKNENSSFASAGLDPLFACHRKLLVVSCRSVVTMSCRHGFYEFLYLNRYINKVELVGVIVSKELKRNRVIIVIDDGTGLLECVKFFDSKLSSSSVPLRHIHLGVLVSVKGTLAIMNSELVLHLTTADPIFDPSYELLHWTACMQLHCTIYSQPWIGPDEHINRDVQQSAVSRSCSCAVPVHVKERLLFCTCMPSGTGTSTGTDNAVDVTSSFRLPFLLLLLRREDALSTSTSEECTVPLRISFRELRHDEEVRRLCLEYSTELSSSPAKAAASTRPTSSEVSLSCGHPMPPPAPRPRPSSAMDDETTVMWLLRAVCRSLHRTGVFCLVDLSADVYELVSRERVIQPTLHRLAREVISEAGGGADAFGDNVHHEVLRLAQVEKSLQTVPRWKLLRCLLTIDLAGKRDEGGEPVT